MRIDLIRWRILRMGLRQPFTTSFGTQTDRTFLLVEVGSDGTVGWGEVTAFSAPLYNEEFTAGAEEVIRGFLAPALIGKEMDHPSRAHKAMAFVRGHAMAKAGLEGGIWDLWSRLQDIPLHEALGGTHRAVEVGVSIGIQDSPERLVDVVSAFSAAGYRRVKLKIEPGRDFRYVAAVRKQFPDLPIMVDANSAYTLADADHLRKMDDLGLMMIEQPLDHDDMVEHAALQTRLRTPICLDESIRSPKAARDAIALGACRIINIKIGRLGGLTPAIHCHDICQEAGVPVWCGGMLESGVGRAHNVAVATLPNFTLPGDTAASSRYWDEDIIEPEVLVSPEGTICPPTGPGIGYRPLLERIAMRTESLVELRA